MNSKEIKVNKKLTIKNLYFAFASDIQLVKKISHWCTPIGLERR
jgi:hypothetical protein